MSNGIIPAFLVQNFLYFLYQQTDPEGKAEETVEERKPVKHTSRHYWTNLTIASCMFLLQKIVICVSPALEQLTTSDNPGRLAI